MSIETDLRSALSGIAGGRVYPLHLPQNPTYPAVSYFAVGGERQRTFGAAAGRMARIQIDVWALTYAEAKSVMSSIRTTLLTLQMTFEGDEEDFYENEAGIYHVSLDIFMYS